MREKKVLDLPNRGVSFIFGVDFGSKDGTLYSA
jgi:hypothetical protein